MKMDAKMKMLEKLKEMMREMQGESRSMLMGKEEECEECEGEGCEMCEEMEDMMEMPKNKVVVAGDSPEALEEGLSKAQEIMKQREKMKK